MDSKLSEKGKKTKKELLDAAYNLFLERGIHATSVDDILRDAGKGKSQFYHYFKNKEDLIHRLLQEHLAELKSGSPPYKMDIHSWEDLETWLKKLIEFYSSLGQAKGCILGMIGQETAPEQELIRQDLQMIFDFKLKDPHAFFITLKAQGALKNGIEPEDLSTLLLSHIQGSVLLVKVYQDEHMFNKNIPLIISALKAFDTSL